MRLRFPTLPDLPCALLELYEAGCTAAADLRVLPPITLEQWKRVLAPQRPLQIRFEGHPRVGTLELDALVNLIVERPKYSEIHLNFTRLSPSQQEQLRNARASIKQPPVSTPKPMPRTTAPIPKPGAADAMSSKRRLGTVLIQMGYVTDAQMDEAAKLARLKGQRLGRYLVGSGVVSADVLCRALALQSGLPVTDLAEAEITDDLCAVFPMPLLMRYNFVPFDTSSRMVCIAAATPLMPAVVQEIEKACNKKVEVFLAREDVITKHLSGLRRHHAAQSRRFIRYDCEIPTTYQLCTRFTGPIEQVVHQGVTKNISEGGLLIYGSPSTQARPEDLLRQGVFARITVGDQVGHQVHALCRIKAIKDLSGHWQMGLEFTELSSEDRRTLKELCVRAMLAKGQPQQPEK
jgi:hypothetical protein